MRQFFARRGIWTNGQWIPTAQISVLVALLDGCSLRSHRDLEGNKHYELHALSGEKRRIELDVVNSMRNKRLIETNHKFPSATYLLTGHGERVAQKLHKNPHYRPLTARKFTKKD